MSCRGCVVAFLANDLICHLMLTMSRGLPSFYTPKSTTAFVWTSDDFGRHPGCWPRLRDRGACTLLLVTWKVPDETSFDRVNTCGHRRPYTWRGDRQRWWLCTIRPRALCLYYRWLSVQGSMLSESFRVGTLNPTSTELKVTRWLGPPLYSLLPA
jgi:hypothetical protein